MNETGETMIMTETECEIWNDSKDEIEIQP